LARNDVALIPTLVRGSLRDAPELCMKPSPLWAEFCQHLRHDQLQLWQVNRRDFPKLLVVEALVSIVATPSISSRI
jgi:hypothetical protein